MIKKISIRGYRSLVDVQINLDHVNVLIGPNSTGKSSFIELLGLLRDAATGFLALGVKGRGGIFSIRSALPGTDTVSVVLDIQIVQAGQLRTLCYSIALDQAGTDAIVADERLTQLTADVPERDLLRRRQGSAFFFNEVSEKPDPAIRLSENTESAISQVRQPFNYAGAHNVATLLSSIQVYDPLYSARYAPHRLPRAGAGESTLYQDSSNLSNVLSTRLSDDQFQADFDHFVRLGFPDHRRVHFTPDSTGEGRIVLSWHSEHVNRPLYLWELSDGFYKYLCLLAVLLRPPSNFVVCLDEPEVGLHPRLLPVVADLVRSAADTAQVIVTTHSPSLVSHFEASEVIVAEAADGQSRFERLAQRDLSKWLTEFTLGELMAMGELEQQR